MCSFFFGLEYIEAEAYIYFLLFSFFFFFFSFCDLKHLKLKIKILVKNASHILFKIAFGFENQFFLENRSKIKGEIEISVCI